MLWNVFIALLQDILLLLPCYGAGIRIRHDWTNKVVLNKINFEAINLIAMKRPLASSCFISLAHCWFIL